MTLLGVSAGNTAGAVVNRSCGSGYIIACEEAQITADRGSTFVYGADRRHYDDLTDTWPPNADNVFGRISGHATADFEKDRFPVMSSKYAGATWAQVGAASGGSIYNTIVARGNAIKAWQDSHIGLRKWGCTFAWSFHHEPNNDNGPAGMSEADWRAAIQNIVTIWQGLGVRFWAGSMSSGGVLTTTQEGIILSINLISGETSGGHQNEWDLWWPPGHAWMNANMVWAAADGYNNGTIFKPFSFIFKTYKTWTDAKRISQAAAGRPFLAGMFETGTQTGSVYTDPSSPHATWTAAMGAPTKANWFKQMSEFCAASWPMLFAVCYWDSFITTHYRIDTTVPDWDGWVAITDDPAWATPASPGSGWGSGGWGSLPWGGGAVGPKSVLAAHLSVPISMYSPKTAYKVALPPSLAVPVTMHQPAAVLPAGTQNIEAALLTVPVSLFSPTVTPPDSNIVEMDHLAVPVTMYAPTVSSLIEAAHFTALVTLFAPSVTQPTLPNPTVQVSDRPLHTCEASDAPLHTAQADDRRIP